MAEKPKKDKDKSVDELFDEDFAEVQAELEAEEKAVKDKPVQEEAESPESPVKEEVVEEVSSKDVGEVADDAEITTDEEVEELPQPGVVRPALARQFDWFGHQRGAGGWRTRCVAPSGSRDPSSRPCRWFIPGNPGERVEGSFCRCSRPEYRNCSGAAQRAYSWRDISTERRF